MTQVTARCIAQTVGTEKPVMVSATLRDKSKETVNRVCEELKLLLAGQKNQPEGQK